MRRLLPLVSLLLVASCSATPGAAISGGTTTGAGSTGSGGAGGAGGPGGAAGGGGSVPGPACTGVAVESPFLTIEDPNGGLDLPNLVTVATVPPTAAIVYSDQAPPPPPMVPPLWPSPPVTGPTVRIGAFAGWGAWPPAAPEVAVPFFVVPADVSPGAGSIVPMPSYSLVTASAGSGVGPSPSFGVFFQSFGPDVTYLDPDVQANGGAGAATDTPIAWGPAMAIMLSGNAAAGGYLGGAVILYDVAEYGLALLYVAPNSVGGANFSYGMWVACASTPIAADAAALDQGWVVAAAASSEAGLLSGEECPSVVGPATTLTVVNLQAPTPGEWPGQVGEPAAMQTPAPVDRIRMAPRSGGAWMVWSLDGGTVLTAGVVLGTSTAGGPAIQTTFPVPVLGGTLSPTSFAVDALGDALVVAAVDKVSGENDQIQVTAQDDTGATKWAVTLRTDGTVEDALSLRAGPDGNALLVAWSELPAMGENKVVRIARLSCPAGP